VVGAINQAVAKEKAKKIREQIEAMEALVAQLQGQMRNSVRIVDQLKATDVSRVPFYPYISSFPWAHFPCFTEADSPVRPM
jgi:hypothetical protein